MSDKRWAEVGDLIIQRGDVFSPPANTSNPMYYGLVTKVFNKYGTRNVLIKWSEKMPPEYNEEHGYAQITIHNSHGRFSVTKVCR